MPSLVDETYFSAGMLAQRLEQADYALTKARRTYLATHFPDFAQHKNEAISQMVDFAYLEELLVETLDMARALETTLRNEHVERQKDSE